MVAPTKRAGEAMQTSRSIGMTNATEFHSQTGTTHENEEDMNTVIGSRTPRRVSARAGAFVGIVAALAVACGGGEKKAGGESATAGAPGGAGATAATGGMPAGLPAPAPGVAPAGATLAMLAEGDSIFHGLKAGGLCQTCHGPDAAGTPLAPPLANKQQWLTGDGSYDFIQKRVTTGMPQPTPPYSSPMLPFGGAQLTPDQVKSVSAYVYSISHKT
jgi:mono/diheme cytochrome c family protein